LFLNQKNQGLLDKDNFKKLKNDWRSECNGGTPKDTGLSDEEKVAKLGSRVADAERQMFAKVQQLTQNVRLSDIVNLVIGGVVPNQM
jgi:hypothetical protein